MKDQYFGDINDYRKYGLLRGLILGGGLRTTVCWMLTPRDDGPDGRRTRYLEDPGRWRHLDPRLFDALAESVLVRGDRDVGQVEVAGLLPGARFHCALVPRELVRRGGYMQALWGLSAGSDLVFFDPDNGLEVPRVPPGSKGSERYLYWSEAVATFKTGASLLIYQHLARVKRNVYIARLARKIQSECQVDAVFTIRTPHVLFLLVPQLGTEPDWRHKLATVNVGWGSQFIISEHSEP